MIFQQIRAGGDRNFGYLIGDEESKEAVIIDPSSAPEVFPPAAEKHGLKIVCIIGTHGRWRRWRIHHMVRSAYR
ncbi:hypothetical protein ACFL6S_24755, partial [Candidatus Poribacteria bacterium]